MRPSKARFTSNLFLPLICSCLPSTIFQTMKNKLFALPIVFLFLLMLCCAPPARTSHNSTLSDQHALLAFKNSLALDSRDSLLNWTANYSLCSWRGVICSSGPKRAPRVVSLNLTGMALVGPISPFLGNVSFLRVLDLRYNNFHGQIPYELGRRFCLRFLRLTYNRLSDSIPSEIGLLPNLEDVRLGENQLTGTIPSFLPHLTLLNLQHNNFTKDIPAFLSNCTRLQILSLAGNHFTGHVPWTFGTHHN